ncbi:hypothetical protein [Streptomyces sp. NPDC058084]|uniref:hypothetical protein n=1 Tax=Streptomyces sp. NPDC058084 TaxID=3346333 RepID=UPI0036E8BE3D
MIPPLNSGARTWHIELPTGLTLMTSNERLYHLQRSDRTRALRQAARIATQVARVPHLERAYVTCYLRARDRRRRDPGNWYPSAKAALDGIVDAGVLTDDDATRLLGPDMRLGDVLKTGPQLLLVVTDLTQMDPDHLALLDPLGVAA